MSVQGDWMLKKFPYCRLAFLTVFLLVGRKPANADTTVTASEGFGGTFTLTVTGFVTDPITLATSCANCTVTLMIDTSMLTTPGDGLHTQDSIDAVAFKLANGSTVGTGFTGDPGATWNAPQLTSLNSSGNLCSGMGMDIQVCSSPNTTQFAPKPERTLTSVWTDVMSSIPL